MNNNTHKFELNTFDLDVKNCKKNIKNFLDKIESDNNDNFDIELLKNNVNTFNNIANFTNVIFFSEKLSKYKKKINKIIIITNDNEDFLLRNVITIITNLLSYEIEKIIEWKII
jgi:hypothetical protein